MRSSRRVYRREVRQLADAAERLVASMAPGEALHQWMRLFVDYIATKKVIARRYPRWSVGRPTFMRRRAC